MTDFYLITGFLGAGKTTFLKNFLQLLRPRRIHLIINEFGKEGVDAALLKELGTALAEVNNGSIFCSCRLDKFEQTLADALNQQPDIIVTEASGLADPTNVRRVLTQFSQINYKGSICLADAIRLPKLYTTAVVCARQLAVSSLVLLNKTDLACASQQAAAREIIQQANPAAQIVCTSFGEIQPEWLQAVQPTPDIEAATAAKDITLQKQCLRVSPQMQRDAFFKCLAQLSESTYRMKGFVQLADGCFLVDCTGTDVQLTPWSGTANNRLVLLAGKGLPLRKAVKTALQWYGEHIFIDTEEPHD